MVSISMAQNQEHAAPDRRLKPPAMLAFTVFAATMAALALAIAVELLGLIELPDGSPSQFGVMAVTTFTIAAGLAAYRSLTIRNAWIGAVAAVLVGPGAIWSWAAFVATNPPHPLTTLLVAIASVGLAAGLVFAGIRATHWLEVFSGLGALGLGLVALLVLPMGSIDRAGPVPALLAAVAGMTCVYGLLVDLELAEHRSLVELVESRRRIEDEVTRVEELLHDLRSGLLAIEAAIGTVDDELAAPLRSEAARLRRLTLTGARTVDAFDLASGTSAMVAARRQGGCEVILRGPERAMAWGEESEVLAIVDNLLANAERHGAGGPIEVEVATGADATRLTVTNSGELRVADPEVVFRRGMTTHPEGRGLGLARARMLAGLNGGDLRVGLAEAGRTSFVLSLRTEPSTAVA
ncbi:MAG: ATP-binding protein [Actinomycetota bacterium]